MKITIATTTSSINLGDILFTLFFLGFIALVIVLVVLVIRTNSRRKQQLDRIERKIDSLNQSENRG